MLRSFQTSVSAIDQYQQRLDVIANNIANVGTSGFKTGRTELADSFSQTLQAAGSTGSMQVGSGVQTVAIQDEFTQGAISRTGVKTDLAVSGDGFFVVRNAAGESFATRAGEFRVDGEGYLVNSQGLRVQGFSDAGLGTRDDIVIDAVGAPATAASGATIANFAIDNAGKVHVRLSDGTEFVRGQVLLQRFRDPQALSKEGDNLLSGFAAAGALAQTEASGTNGLGRIESGALEMSNVDLADEMSSLITTQRAFQANARILTTSDEILQELVNLKR